MKVVIVGGVAGGATAAARLRRLDEKAEIIIFEKSGFISYANCGLPYYIGGVIKDKRELTLQTPKSFWNRFRINAKVNHEVLKINRDRKTVSVKNLESGETFEESYDKLILSPGGKPVIPDYPGMKSDRIFTLRTVEDTFKIRDAVNNSKTVAVIGGGFIGVEVAENLKEAGLDVSLIQRSDHILPPIDSDMASFLHAHIRKSGVKLMLNQKVLGFEQEESANDSDKGNPSNITQPIKVMLENRAPLPVDFVVLAVGVQPDSHLAKEAGLELGPKDSIVVDDHMRTSDLDIYAAGDAVSIKNFVTEKKAVIALAGPANKEGRIIANNIVGLESTYKGTPGSSILKVFKMTAGFTGLNENSAKAERYDYEKIIISPASHASYYPGGTAMTLKLIYEKSTEKILGAQIVGFDGVDKRLDVISTAMQAGMKVTDLADLELSYAPPYSSAKDPVNMAGFVAGNIINGIVKQFHYEDLDQLLKMIECEGTVLSNAKENGQGACTSGIILLDTRTEIEYSRGHAEGFDLNIPVDELRDRISELDKTKTVYVMCQSALRSYIACRILSQESFDCFNFAGGYRFYESIKNDRFNENCKTDCGLN